MHAAADLARDRDPVGNCIDPSEPVATVIQERFVEEVGAICVRPVYLRGRHRGGAAPQVALNAMLSCSAVAALSGHLCYPLKQT